MDDKLGFDELGRPNWDYYFVSLAFLIAQRSLDNSTKCGAIITSKDRTILSVGYNSPPRNCNDAFVPQERDIKYEWYLHAEENAIVNAARAGTCINNSVFYITGYPCERCIRKIINCGAKKIVYAQNNYFSLTEQTKKTVEAMLKNQDIEVIELKNVEPIKEILKGTINYIDSKNK